MTLEAPANEFYPGGELWRSVINFIGDEPITPALYLPLLDHAAPGGDRWSYFVGRMADKLREDRHDIEEQVARAELGYRIWTERREALARWARVGPEDLEDWWLHGQPTVEDHERQRQFIKAMGLTKADLGLIEEDLGRGWERIVIPRLRSNLRPLAHLDILRTLARKTWPADSRDRVGWTEDELDMVNYFYGEQEPGLFGDARDGVYDPFGLEVISVEGGLGFGMGDLTYCLYVLLRATVIDFADDLLHASKFPRARGSLRCIECGQFVGRRALGYGQLYCEDRCKKRAAKRRYRVGKLAVVR
jgi:hypothetical protein